MSWNDFLRIHWETLAAADFFTIEVRSRIGLVRYVVLFAVELSTRRVQVIGIRSDSDGQRMKQVAKNLVDPCERFHLVREYVEHCHHERPHQAKGNRPLDDTLVTGSAGEVVCRERLGGVLKRYYRQAA
jgi:hypothetical protein